MDPVFSSLLQLLLPLQTRHFVLSGSRHLQQRARLPSQVTNFVNYIYYLRDPLGAMYEQASYRSQLAYLALLYTNRIMHHLGIFIPPNSFFLNLRSLSPAKLIRLCRLLVFLALHSLWLGELVRINHIWEPFFSGPKALFSRAIDL